MKKNDLFTLIEGFSPEERHAFSAYLQKRKYRDEVSQFYAAFLSGGCGGSLAESMVSDSRNYRLIHDLSNIAVDFLVEGQCSVDVKADAFIRKAKVFIRIGEWAKALKLIRKALGVAERVEDYSVVPIANRLAVQIGNRSNDPAIKAESRALQLALVPKQKELYWECQIQALHIEYEQLALQPKLKNGAIQLGQLREFEDKLMALEGQSAAKRFLFLYHYLGYTLAFQSKNYPLADQSNAKVISLLSQSEFIKNEYPEHLFKALHFRVMLHSKIMNLEIAQNALVQLRPTQGSSVGQIWRFIQSNLIISEYFQKPEYTLEAEKHFFYFQSILRAGMSTHEYIGILYYFVKNKIVFNCREGVRAMLLEISKFEKAEIKIEIQLYARIVSIVLEWMEGNAGEVARLVKNCRAFIQRAINPDLFPQAMAIVDMVSEVSDQRKKTIPYKQYKMVFQAFKDQNIPEMNYLSFLNIFEYAVGGLKVI